MQSTQTSKWTRVIVGNQITNEGRLYFMFFFLLLEKLYNILDNSDDWLDVVWRERKKAPKLIVRQVPQSHFYFVKFDYFVCRSNRLFLWDLNGIIVFHGLLKLNLDLISVCFTLILIVWIDFSLLNNRKIPDQVEFNLGIIKKHQSSLQIQYQTKFPPKHRLTYEIRHIWFDISFIRYNW